jgi:hypothetical protein
MESPNATMAVASWLFISTASRKNHDAVVLGNSVIPATPPSAPVPGLLMKDVVSALACQVIGPLSPTT